MKILVINIPAGPEDGPFGDWARNYYVPLLKKNIDAVKAPGTEVTYRFCEKGLGPVDMAFYRYMDNMGADMVFHAAQHAEEEGFDAVMIDCYGDQKLYDIRQMINIPIVGLGEASVTLAQLMGLNFGFVAVSPMMMPGQHERMVQYGLDKKLWGQLPVEGWDQGDTGDLIDASDKIERVTRTAKKMVEDGCEVIIPACSITSPMMKFAPGCEDKYPNGVTEIDGAPVVDVVGCAFKVAEALASLKNAGSAWISRKNLYRQPPAELVEEAKYLLEDDSYVYWDITDADYE